MFSIIKYATDLSTQNCRTQRIDLEKKKIIFFTLWICKLFELFLIDFELVKIETLDKCGENDKKKQFFMFLFGKGSNITIEKKWEKQVINVIGMK